MRRNLRATFLLALTFLLAPTLVFAQASPASDAEAAAFRALAANRSASGERDGAIALLRGVIEYDRENAPESLALATDLDALAALLDTPDDDNLWEDAEDLRLEAMGILEGLGETARYRDAVAALSIHYIRREYGRDFAERALAYFDLIAGEPDADSRSVALLEEACRRGDFANFPKLGLDFAETATAYLARFPHSNDAVVTCTVTGLGRLLAIGRELEGLDRYSAELARIAAGPSMKAETALDALDLRLRVLLAAGRYDDAVVVAETAVARTAAADAAAALRSRALALRADARFRNGDAAGAAADATDAVLGFDSVGPADAVHRIIALDLLAEILSTIPDRRTAVPALLSRARELARGAAVAGTDGWEDALHRTYTLAVSQHLADGDPGAASAVADELARFNAEVLKLSWLQDWANLVDFPANVALLLYRQEFQWAEHQLNLVRDGLEARYFTQHNYFASPLVRADLAEYAVLLALLRANGDAAGSLDATSLLGNLDEALAIRSDSLPETHPLTIQHYALRAVAFARLDRAEEALAAAREGLRRFVARGVPPREAGGSITALFVDPVYRQLVLAAWLGTGALPR